MEFFLRVGVFAHGIHNGTGAFASGAIFSFSYGIGTLVLL
jgi:hypothetical protein